MAGEETAQMVVEAAAKAPEVLKSTIELMEKLMSLLGGLTRTAIKVVQAPVDMVASGVKFATSLSPKGQVMSAAAKAGVGVAGSVNIPISQKEMLKDFCQKAGIPIAFKTAKGGQNFTVSFPENYKAAFADAMSDTLKESLKVNPKDYAITRLKPGEAVTMKSMLEKNGIDANFAKLGGDVVCVFQNKDARAVELVHADYRAVREDISKNFACGFDKDRQQFFISDKITDKTLWLKNCKTEHKIESVLRERFGYSHEQAQVAARVFGAKLSPEMLRAYKLDTRQAEVLQNMTLDLKRPDDGLLLRDIDFAHINFKADGKDRFIISDGERAVTLIPAEMSKEQMETLVREKLGVTDAETVKQICDKSETLGKEFSDKTAAIDTRGKYSIEKMSSGEFKVGLDGKDVQYSFSDKQKTVAALQKQFGMSKDKASEIFQKAKAQNAIANAASRAKEKAAAQKATKQNTPKTPKKGARK